MLAAQILQQGAQALGHRVHLLARPADRFFEVPLLQFPHTGHRFYPPSVVSHAVRPRATTTRTQIGPPVVPDSDRRRLTSVRNPA